MVDSEISGVMFTADPATGDRTHWSSRPPSLGEVVVGGQVEPDTYVVSKERPRILHQHIGTKAEKIAATTGATAGCSSRTTRRWVLDESTLKGVAGLGIEIERHYGKPQDIEFAVADHHISIVQSRPIDDAVRRRPVRDQPPDGTVLVTGSAAAPGLGTGTGPHPASSSEGAASPPARSWSRR